jgi:hypothetical protein
MATLTEDRKRYRAAMPKIPGVPVNSAQPARSAPAEPEPSAFSPLSLLASPATRLTLALLAALTVGAAIAWWMMRAPRKPAATHGEASSAAAPVTKPQAVIVPPRGPVEIARVQELAKPWAAKRFSFRTRLTNESMPAMVVHLPGGTTYWAFALQAPFGHCELEFVTDLRKLASQYGYRATHPMVANPCNAAVYDPLRMGTLASGAWARGEVVQGAGVRPPVSIDVQVKGDRLFASQME